MASSTECAAIFSVRIIDPQDIQRRQRVRRYTYDGVIHHESFHAFKEAAGFHNRTESAKTQSLLSRSAYELQVKGSSFAAIRHNGADCAAIRTRKGVFVIALKRNG